MIIKILGNGGAINDGLAYNAFAINGTLLCETPPDIMLSINKNSIDLASIDRIYISHLHGDHIFGLPFLILSAFFEDVAFVVILGTAIITTVGVSIISHYEMKKLKESEQQNNVGNMDAKVDIITNQENNDNQNIN